MGQNRATYVYIIRGPSGFKVGYSERPYVRLSALQGGTTDKLSLYHEVAYKTSAQAKAIERKVHGLLASWKIRGEWFNCRIEIIKIAIEAAQAECPRQTEFIQLRAQNDADARKRLEAEFADLQYLAEGGDPEWPKGVRAESKRGMRAMAWHKRRRHVWKEMPPVKFPP